MGIAKARLIQDVSILRIVRRLAAEWDDTEKDVCLTLSKLFESEVSGFFVPIRQLIGSSRSKIKDGIGGGGVSVASKLRQVARDGDWLKAKVTRYGFKYSGIQISVGRVHVERRFIERLLQEHSLPVPPLWTRQNINTKSAVPTAARPLTKLEMQITTLISKTKELGFDPLSVPRGGKVKVRKALIKDGWTTDIFDRVWKRTEKVRSAIHEKSHPKTLPDNK